MSALDRPYFITLIFLVLLLSYLSYEVFRPFLPPLSWAVVLSILFYPVYAFIFRYVGLRTVASLAVLGLILTIILGPVSYLSFLLVRELAGLADYLEGDKFDALREMYRHPVLTAIIEKVSSSLGVSDEELRKTFVDNIAQLRKGAAVAITKRAVDAVSSLLNFLFMSVSIFFLLRDGPGFLKKVLYYMPFSEEQKTRLMKQVTDMIVSTLYGGVVVAVVQGSMGGIAFAVLGIPSPVLWGFVMAIASFLPVIGPFIVWAPAALYLALQDAVLKGIVLAIIGMFGISAIDNVLRPLIIGSRTKMPFLVLFFSVLGGIKLFGLMGFVMGPLVIAMFISVIEIFRGMEEGRDV